MSENKNTWVSTAADKLLLLSLVFSSTRHICISPQNLLFLHIQYPLPLPPPTSLLLLVCCLCLQLIFSFRFCSDCAHLYATFSFRVCLTKALPVYACVHVCVWLWVWLHVRVCVAAWRTALSWVNTLAAARAVYVVDVNTIASWQIVLETFEGSQFGRDSRLLFNNWMALQFAAFLGSNKALTVCALWTRVQGSKQKLSRIELVRCERKGFSLMQRNTKGTLVFQFCKNILKLLFESRMILSWVWKLNLLYCN